MTDKRLEKQGKYYRTFEHYCMKPSLFCTRCNTVNGSFVSAAINQKGWFTLKIRCQNCGSFLSKGPYSAEKMKMLARMTARERDFELAYVWHCFLMLSEYPERLELPHMFGEYQQWRSSILMIVRKVQTGTTTSGGRDIAPCTTLEQGVPAGVWSRRADRIW